MQRRLVVAPFVLVGLALLPAGAGALSAPAPLPAPGPAPVALPAPVAAAVAPVLAAPLPAPLAAPVQAVAVAPATPVVPTNARDAQLHAELCAARPVFCEVDSSGHYIVR